MNKIIKNTFIAIVGIASLIVIASFGTFIYIKIDEALIKRVVNPEISLQKINQWESANKLVFTTIAENKSEIEWEHVGIIIKLKKEDGSFFKRCETVLFNKPFITGPVDIEVICQNMPSPIPKYTYEVKVIGEY